MRSSAVRLWPLATAGICGLVGRTNRVKSQRLSTGSADAKMPPQVGMLQPEPVPSVNKHGRVSAVQYSAVQCCCARWPAGAAAAPTPVLGASTHRKGCCLPMVVLHPTNCCRHAVASSLTAQQQIPGERSRVVKLTSGVPTCRGGHSGQPAWPHSHNTR